MLGGHKGLYWFWAEHPYVQFAAARVTGTWFAVGVTNRRERERIPVSGGRSEQVLKARLPLSRVLVSCSFVLDPLVEILIPLSWGALLPLL